MTDQVLQAPLWRHVAVLAGVLLLVSLALRPYAMAFTDEGAAVLQARHLNDTGQWLIGSPPASLDPDGSAALPVLADVGDNGRTFYSKHPLYVVVLAFGDSVLGRFGMAMVSLLGLLLAAWAAGATAAMHSRRAGPLAVWITAIATPLFWYGNVMLAHAPAAGVAAVAVLAAAKLMAGGPRWWWLLLLSATALGPLLRTEAVFVAPALAVAVIFAWRTHRSVAVALGGLFGVATGVVVDRLWASSILRDARLPDTLGDVGWLEGRLSAIYATVLRPNYAGGEQAGLLLLGLVFLVVSAVAARRGSAFLERVAGAGAALFYVGAGLVGPADPWPGLLYTVPLVLWVFLRYLSQATVRAELVRFALATAGLFALAVVVTQYSAGGGVEWGGRFFALAWPAVVVAVAVLLDQVRPGVRALWPALVPLAVTVAFIPICLKGAHAGAAQFERRTAEAIQRFGGDDGMVVVWTQPLIPAVMWNGLDVHQWLGPEREDLPSTLSDVAASGVDRFALITLQPEADVLLVPESYRVEETVTLGDGARRFVVLVRR